MEKFYTFWDKFDSWREFEDDEAHDIDQVGPAHTEGLSMASRSLTRNACAAQADSREERRWMERENNRQKQKMKKKENNRLGRLVDNAYKSDPRVILAKKVWPAPCDRLCDTM